MKTALGLLVQAALGVVGARVGGLAAVTAAENNLLPDAAKWPKLRAFVGDAIVVAAVVPAVIVGGKLAGYVGGKAVVKKAA